MVASETSELVTLFDIDLADDHLPTTSWNVAPTERVLLVIDRDDKESAHKSGTVRRLAAARWGLVPSWSKGPNSGPTTFNARSETAASKPMFASALSKRRAIVPATGYYEWKIVDGAKIPYFIHRPGAELFAFAALFDWWRDPAATEAPGEGWLLSTTIVTRASTGALASIHDRMPVFLPQDRIDDWLDPRELKAEHLLATAVADAATMELSTEFYEVDRAVGSVRNNSADLIAPVRPAR